MSHSKSGPSKRAFTLIELLVVIAIIAILAAILFPVFAQAKAAAKTTASLSNMKQLATSYQMYIGDYDDMSMLPWQTGIYPAQLMYPYTKNTGIYWDASSPKPNFAEPMTGDYWGNWTLYQTLTWSNQGLYWDGGPRNVSGQDNPAARMILQALSRNRTFNGTTMDLGEVAINSTEQSCYDTANDDWTSSKRQGTTRAADLRHRGGYLTGYMDGHAGIKKGMALRTKQCYEQAVQFWQAGNGGNRDAQTVNEWAKFYLSPDKLQYWGTYWDPSR